MMLCFWYIVNNQQRWGEDVDMSNYTFPSGSDDKNILLSEVLKLIPGANIIKGVNNFTISVALCNDVRVVKIPYWHKRKIIKFLDKKIKNTPHLKKA